MPLRQTKQRQAIRSTFSTAGRPLAPQEILARARADGPTLSLATVYRAVQALVSEGFIAPVAIAGQSDRYELADLDHHHHFCCRACDRVFDIEGCPAAVESLAPQGFAVDSHEVVLYGECASCKG